MRVTFVRTGERRYRVVVEREAFPDLFIEPAPGYDADLPHDLVHFLVERHWGLRDGIFGDLAAGGTAGTFRPVEETRDRRWVRKHGGVVSGKDMDRSEALAAAAFAAWQGHAGRVPTGSDYARKTADAASADASELEGVMPALDEAAARWRPLRVGESISFDWPGEASRHRGATRAPRAAGRGRRR